MITALFARPNHPQGYGMQGGTAHGYVVLMVRCQSPAEVEKVVDRLRKPFKGIQDSNQYGSGNLSDWYGGEFDFLGYIAGEPNLGMWNAARFVSKGDNRFVGIYEASEVLDAALE